MNREPLNIETRHEQDAIVVSPSGDIGYTEATQFRDSLRRAHDERAPRIVVDLSRVDFMTTPGLASLVEALQTAKKRGSKLVLCSLTPKVRAVFEIARLHTVFMIVDSPEAALSA